MKNIPNENAEVKSTSDKPSDIRRLAEQSAPAGANSERDGKNSICAIFIPKGKSPFVGPGSLETAHGRRYLLCRAGEGITIDMPDEDRRLGKGYWLLTEAQMPEKLLRRGRRELRDGRRLGYDIATLSAADLPAIRKKIKEVNSPKARRKAEAAAKEIARRIREHKDCLHPYAWRELGKYEDCDAWIEHRHDCGACAHCRHNGTEPDHERISDFRAARNAFEEGDIRVTLLAGGPPLLRTPMPKGGDGAAEKPHGYCTCMYKKQVYNKKTGNWGIGWFSRGTCEHCVEQRRLERYKIAEVGVQKSVAAGVQDFYVTEPFFSKPQVFQRKIQGKKSGIWWGWVPGEKEPRAFCDDKKASLAALKDLYARRSIVANIDGDDLLRGVREAGGGTATGHLPTGERVVYSDRPIAGVASRKVDAAGILAATKSTLAQCEPRGQGRPIMTFSGTWKPPKKEREEKKEPVLEVGKTCTWTMEEIQALCRELAVVIKPVSASGKIKHRIEFLCRNFETEGELRRRLSGPSPREEALREETEAGKRQEIILDHAGVQMAEDSAIGSG